MFSLIMLLSCVLLAFVCILNGNSHRCRALFHNLVQVSCLTSCLSIRAGHTHIWKMYPAIPCVTSLTAISSNSCANLLYICHKAMCIANCKYNLNSVSCLGVWVPQDNWNSLCVENAIDSDPIQLLASHHCCCNLQWNMDCTYLICRVFWFCG
jgi:hypothetical protein